MHGVSKTNDAYELAMLAAHCQYIEDELDLKYFKSFSETTREFLKAKQKEKIPIHTIIVLLKDREKTLLEAYERYLKIGNNEKT